MAHLKLHIDYECENISTLNVSFFQWVVTMILDLSIYAKRILDGYVLYLKKSHGSWNYNRINCVYDGSSSVENLMVTDLEIFSYW